MAIAGKSRLSTTGRRRTFGLSLPDRFDLPGGDPALRPPEAVGTAVPKDPFAALLPLDEDVRRPRELRDLELEARPPYRLVVPVDRLLARRALRQFLE